MTRLSSCCVLGFAWAFAVVVRWVDRACFDIGVKGGHADPSKFVVVAHLGFEKAVADCTEKIVLVVDVSF